jgi:hypothetical protein
MPNLKGREVAIQVIKNLREKGMLVDVNINEIVEEVSTLTGSIDKGYMTRFVKSMVMAGMIKPTREQGIFQIIYKDDADATN